MKIKKILFLFYLILTNNYSYAQHINDSIFKNVILIQQEDIVKDADDYLIDVIFKYNSKKNPIIFNDSRLSKQFITNRFLENKPVILITPDWKYYDEIAEEAEQMGGCIEPATTNIFYQRKYLENEQKIDSVRISGNQPKIVFNKSVRNLKANKEIIFYHTESFGSTCCPKDPKWKIKQRLDGFITSFEKTNDVKLGEIYKKIRGKEGEHILYFTLSNLNKEQKLNFLQLIRYWHFENQETKYIVFAPQIFTANVIKKEGLKLITE